MLTIESEVETNVWLKSYISQLCLEGGRSSFILQNSIKEKKVQSGRILSFSSSLTKNKIPQFVDACAWSLVIIVLLADGPVTLTAQRMSNENRQCFRCNRFTLSRDAPWLSRWSSTCPVCGGKWRK
jgi:hypothetical protein